MILPIEINLTINLSQPLRNWTYNPKSLMLNIFKFVKLIRQRTFNIMTINTFLLLLLVIANYTNLFLNLRKIRH